MIGLNPVLSTHHWLEFLRVRILRISSDIVDVSTNAMNCPRCSLKIRWCSPRDKEIMWRNSHYPRHSGMDVIELDEPLFSIMLRDGHPVESRSNPSEI